MTVDAKASLSNEQLTALLEEHQYLINMIVIKYLKSHPTYWYMKDEWIHECTVKFWEEAERYDGERGAKFTTWMWTVLTNYCSNLFKYECRMGLKRNAYGNQRKKNKYHLHPLHTKGGEELEGKETEHKGMFDDMIHSLSDNQKRIMKMKFQGQMTEEEICKELGVSQQAVNQCINRALNQLRKGVQ